MTETPSPENTSNIATGASYGVTVRAEHAVNAVKNAMQKAGIKSASSVLLFLSNGYSLQSSQEAKIAIKAAAKTASTVQVFGCSAAGLLSEEDCFLDGEGAVAMVFPNGCALSPASVLGVQDNPQENSQENPANQQLLCISSPESSKIAINHLEQEMIGAISSNEFGQGDFPVWQGSRISKTGFFHAGFATNENALTGHTVVSQGVRRLSKNQKITEANNNCLLTIDSVPSTESIKNALPENLFDLFREQPFHTLCASSESTDAEGLSQDFIKLHNVVAVDDYEESIYLSGNIKTDQHLFWAIRDRGLAEEEIRHNLQSLAKRVKQPKFAFLFTSISRGPYFFNDEDVDLEAFKKVFPGVPLIGIYSTGEISPGKHYSALSRRYSSVLTVYE